MPFGNDFRYNESRRVICMKRRNHGFTLVELIVVLVILAILAAILVPALLGYIDRAREKQELINAKNCLNAVQAELSEQYAKKGNTLKPGFKPENLIIESKNNQNANTPNGDVNATDTNSARRILELADLKDNKTNGAKDPYIIMFAVGSNISDSTGATKHDKFTVCYFMYMETKDSTPLFYFDGSWTKKHPRIDDKSDLINSNNIVQVGSMKGKRIQYYIISNKTGTIAGKKEFWDIVKKHY